MVGKAGTGSGAQSFPTTHQSFSGLSAWSRKSHGGARHPPHCSAVTWYPGRRQHVEQRVKVKAAQPCLTLCNPKDYAVHGILQARILEWAAFSFSRGSSQPRDPTQVSRIAGRFFTSWATGRPKITGLGSLFLLQRTFPTQESNCGLPHCRRILYQLSHKVIIKASLSPTHLPSLSYIQTQVYL